MTTTNADRARELGFIILTSDTGAGRVRGTAYRVDPDQYFPGDYLIGGPAVTTYGPSRYAVRSRIQSIIENTNATDPNRGF